MLACCPKAATKAEVPGLRQKPAWQRSRVRWAVCCAAFLCMAGYLGFQAREQRLAAWMRPQPASAVAAGELWSDRARDPAAHSFKVLTIATKASRELELLLASCPHPVTVLGAGQRYERYRSKVTLLFDELMCGPSCQPPQCQPMPGFQSATACGSRTCAELCIAYALSTLWSQGHIGELIPALTTGRLRRRM